MTVTTRHEGIMGLRLRTAFPCRCQCVDIQVHPHSKVSGLLVWKCAWCGKRRGKVTDDEIEGLADFVDRHGWNMQPLYFNEDDGAFHLSAEGLPQ
jgi:hypothetical protein